MIDIKPELTSVLLAHSIGDAPNIYNLNPSGENLIHPDYDAVSENKGVVVCKVDAHNLVSYLAT